jgi:glycoside hydrolase-like protein
MAESSERWVNTTSTGFISCVLVAIALLDFGVPYSVAKDYCVTSGGATAVDTSNPPVSQRFLDKMKDVGVKTIIRYYDHEKGGPLNERETIPGKTLRRKERDLIIKNGFDIVVVFQHNNDKLSSFTSTRGRQDAERSLALASENLQPRRSAIYFGVDGDWSHLENIKSYFRALKKVLDQKGYRIGVYGSGLVCKQLIQDGLAQLCWLAGSRSWPGYKQYLDGTNWRLLQLLPPDVTCGGQEVDFNIRNRRYLDYGQFGR